MKRQNHKAIVWLRVCVLAMFCPAFLWRCATVMNLEGGPIESLHAQRVYNHGQEFAGKRNLFYIYVWNKRITLKILPCMAALNTFRTDGEDFGEQILSKVVKAGRRTYFLDVRATRANDYFLTITESRKKTAPDGTVSYDRHKIFLYKEDFSKFLEGLEEVIGFIKREKPEFFEEEHPKPEEYA